MKEDNIFAYILVNGAVIGVIRTSGGANCYFRSFNLSRYRDKQERYKISEWPCALPATLWDDQNYVQRALPHECVVIDDKNVICTVPLGPIREIAKPRSFKPAAQREFERAARDVARATRRLRKIKKRLGC